MSSTPISSAKKACSKYAELCDPGVRIAITFFEFLFIEQQSLVI